MDRNDALYMIRDLISEKLGTRVDIIMESSRFKEDLGADSLDEVLLFFALDERYGPLPIETAYHFKTVGDIVSYLEEYSLKRDVQS
ncbi:MAG: acyl carrier protein [Chitinispirillaceae bacterium]